MALELAITKEELLLLLRRQLAFFMCEHPIEKYAEDALACVEKCFSYVTNKYYQHGGVHISHLFRVLNMRSFSTSFQEVRIGKEIGIQQIRSII